MPNYGQPGVERARFAIESSSYGTDLTSDVPTNFFDLRIAAPTGIDRATLTTPDTTVVQYAYERKNDVLGPDRGQAEIMSWWTGTNQALDSTTSPTKRAQSKMLEALVGGYNADQGSAVASAPTTTGCVVTGGHGSRFTIGTLIGVAVSGVVYPVLVTDVSTDTLTWWPALANAPSVAGAVYNSQSIYLTDTPTKRIQMLWEDAKDRNNIWLGTGGKGDLKLDLARNGLAKWSSTLNFMKWLHDDEIATPQGGGAIALASYDDTAPIYTDEGGFHFNETSLSTRQMIASQSISLNLGIEWFEVGNYAGVEGLDNWERNTRPEIIAELELLAPGQYEAFHDLHRSATDVGFLFWYGSAAGSIRAFAAPTCYIRKVERADVFGMKGLKLTLLLKLNSKSASQATEAGRSPFVLGGI